MRQAATHVASDGQTVFFAEPAVSLNVVNAATWYLPEFGLLILLIWFARRLHTIYRRHPQRRLDPQGNPLHYCRRCNYPFPPHAPPCPECGLKQAPIAGRTPAARIRRSLPVVVGALVLFGIAWFLSPISRTLAWDWLEWESPAAGEWLQSHPTLASSLSPALRQVTAIRQIDVASGRVVHTYYVAAGHSPTLTPAPGGRYIVLCRADKAYHSSVTLIDTRSATARNVVQFGQFVKPSGLSADGKRFYYTDYYTPTALLQLDLDSGQSSVRRTWPPFDRAFSMCSAYVVDDSKSVTECYVGQLGAASGVGDWPTTYALVGPGGQFNGEFGSTEPFRSYLFDPDLCLMFLGESRRTGPSLRRMDLRTGTITVSEQSTGPLGPLYDTASPVILAESTPQPVFQIERGAALNTSSAVGTGPTAEMSVLDRKSGKLLATLAVPANEMIVSGRLSTDGRFLVIEFTSDPEMTEAMVTAIRIWKMPTSPTP